MIRLRKTGEYKLIETKRHIKILSLDKDMFAWVEPLHIGEILVVSHYLHKTDCVLSQGRYRLYDVDDEPYLTDLTHLELEVGKDVWQGYLLLTGLPDSQKQRGRIVPTQEVVTGNPRVDRKRISQRSLAVQK